MRKFPTVQKVDALVCNGSNPSLQLNFLPYCKKFLKKIAKKNSIDQVHLTDKPTRGLGRLTDRQKCKALEQLGKKFSAATFFFSFIPKGTKL